MLLKQGSKSLWDSSFPLRNIHSYPSTYDRDVYTSRTFKLRHLVTILLHHWENEGTGKDQWWERSLPTNVVRVRLGPGAICGLSLLLVLTLLRGFFSWFSGFRSSTKHNTPNSNSTRMEDPHENQPRLTWLPRSVNIVIFIYSSVTPWYLFRLGSKRLI